MTTTENKIEQYVANHISQTDNLLSELYRETHLKTLFSNMISGPVQGKLLEMISCMMRPQRILEIGTFTGYSALCMAKGLQSGGELHTIERNDELEPLIRKYIDRAGLTNSIHLHFGNALDILPAIDGYFDLVFIDAHKPEYCDYYTAVIDKVSPGGFILGDNVLWYNKVVEPIAHNDKDTQGIVAFNTMVHNDPRVENFILPLRDGIMIARKL